MAVTFTGSELAVVGVVVLSILVWGALIALARFQLDLATGGITAVVGNLTVTLLGPGIPIAAVGLVGGLFAGLLGHYFGRDLRDGLTRDL